MRYFEMANIADDCFGAQVAKHQRIRVPGGCERCETLPAQAGPPDIVLVPNRVPPQGVLLHTSWGFGVIRRDLLDCLSGESGYLRLGKLAGPQGVFEDYRTFVGARRVFFRGNKASEHFICPVCRHLIYFYLPRASPYIMESAVSEGLPIYEVESMQLLVNETIRDRIGDRWRSLIKFHPVPIRTTPIDGLPATLDMWPTAEQLEDYTPNPPRLMNQKSSH
jgi:hypothetical protein